MIRARGERLNTMKLFRKKTIVSVTHITHKREKTRRVEFKLDDAKRHIYSVQLSPTESVRVEVEL